jgi:hypothetical protein
LNGLRKTTGAPARAVTLVIIAIVVIIAAFLWVS